MIEQADESGRLDPDEFDETTIVELFGKVSRKCLLSGQIRFYGCWIRSRHRIGCRESVMIK